MTNDNVHSPKHYKLGQLNVEVIDVIENVLTPEEFRGFLKGNRIKYCLRSGKKENESEDLEKECWYAKRLVTILKEPSIHPSEEGSVPHLDTSASDPSQSHPL